MFKLDAFKSFEINNEKLKEIRGGAPDAWCTNGVNGICTNDASLAVANCRMNVDCSEIVPLFFV